MKRDLTNSRTYLPPRVRVVKVFSENTVLNPTSIGVHSPYVDELENVNINGDETEDTYLFEF